MRLATTAVNGRAADAHNVAVSDCRVLSDERVRTIVVTHTAPVYRNSLRAYGDVSSVEWPSSGQESIRRSTRRQAPWGVLESAPSRPVAILTSLYVVRTQAKHLNEAEPRPVVGCGDVNSLPGLSQSCMMAPLDGRQAGPAL